MAVELELKAVVPGYGPAAGAARSEIAWKGPTPRSPEGYKTRVELTCEARPAPDEPGPILEALGYAVVHPGWATA